ncbi:unnamed protein product, partial [Porites evermanni]
RKSGFGATTRHGYHLICCVKFRTETNYSSATSGILHLLLGMTISGNVTSIKAISNLRFSSEFNYSPVSTSYIRNILDHLNPRKAVGVDGISQRILRLGP